MNASLPQPAALRGRTCYRLAGFVALSIAVHVLTVWGTGPFGLTVQAPGNAASGNVLHATIVNPEPQQHDGEASVVDRVSRKDDTAPPTERHETPAGAAHGAEALRLPAPDRWYAANEVDVRAEPLTEVRLRYPEALAGQPLSGTVRIRLFIDEGGVVRKFQITASEPDGVFDEAARRGWQDVRFSPALKSGIPVKSQKLIELTFRPGLI